MKKHILILGVSALSILSAGAQSIKESVFGKTSDGFEVKEFILKNSKGTTVKILDYGAIIRELWVADRNGKLADVVLGFDKISDYETKSPYFGAVVGRYGNRIADGKFSLDGKEFKLPVNDKGTACLHGGKVGFDKKIWKAEAQTTTNAAILKLTLVSPDGDQGFPGNLKVSITYTLNNNNELVMEYSATTDKPTVCNLTNHSYFNLAGNGNGSILDHEITINADKFTVVDEHLIPTGELRGVVGTPFDFRVSNTIGSRIDDDNAQLKNGNGYDHNFVLSKSAPGKLEFAILLRDPLSGRKMAVETTEPGVQFYSGNFLNGEIGKGGKKYPFRGGLALETQHFPDSPNQKDFPSTVLRPGQEYKSKTVLKFSAQ